MDVKTNNGQLRQFVATVVANMPDLPGNVMQKWIENPARLRDILLRALLIVKTFKIGGFFQDASHIRRTFFEKVKIDEATESTFENICLRKDEVEVSIVILSVKELGLKSARYTNICRRAQEFKLLDLCPSEVGPYLRMQYKDQPIGESFFIAMSPIKDSIGDSHLFCVCNDGGNLCLYSDRYSDDDLWDEDTLFAFLLCE